MQHFCSQNIQRLGEFARWPGSNPRLPWHVDLSGYLGTLTAEQLLGAFRQAWSWWAEVAEITPVMVGTAAEALIRKHFARIDGPRGILAWSELADNTGQPKTQRYDSGDHWTVEWFLQAVAAHEIGHVLGLEHDGRESGTLMAPSIDANVPRPTPRDIQRLLALGYKRRTTPIPPPDPPAGPIAADHVRFKRQMPAGDYADFVLGSTVGVGDYRLLLGYDSPPISIPEGQTHG